jgi:hypothetical protein
MSSVACSGWQQCLCDLCPFFLRTHTHAHSHAHTHTRTYTHIHTHAVKWQRVFCCACHTDFKLHFKNDRVSFEAHTIFQSDRVSWRLHAKYLQWLRLAWVLALSIWALCQMKKRSWHIGQVHGCTIILIDLARVKCYSACSLVQINAYS